MVTSTTTTRTTRIGAVRTVIQGVKWSSAARYTPNFLQGAEFLAERLNNTLKMLQSRETRGYYFKELFMNIDEIFTFEYLYDSMWKCKRGKMRKASVARFVINGIDSTLELEEELQNNVYLPRKPRTFKLTYPKPRNCSSMHIRDRVVQRDMNDNVIYPEMVRSFIYDNMACQIGKGTTRMMDRLNQLLHRYYINNGSNAGWVLQCDIKGYYENMDHDVADTCFRRRLGDAVADICKEWMDRQYPGDKGYAPGSQMIQILGISFLNGVDHHAKERLLAGTYCRYMDDFLIISSDRDFLEYCQEEIGKKLAEVKLWLHPKKTRIYPLQKGIKFLGFTFKLTVTGKVIRLIDPDNVKHERKRLYKMAQMVKSGERTIEKFYQCYNSWKAHARLGNTHRLLQRMDAYIKTLLTEDNIYEDHSSCWNDSGTAESGQ